MKTSLPLLEGKFFCTLPWLHLAVFPEGSTKLCCVAESSVNSGGDPLTLQANTLEEVWNSDYMRGVRRDMLAGRAVADCSACYVAEKSGAGSRRIQNNARWAAELGPLLDEIIEASRAADLAVPAPIYYQLMPGNLCNLKCRMCTPLFSSRIEGDPVHSKWVPPLLEHLGRVGADWTTGRVTLAPRQPMGVRCEGFHSVEEFEGKPFRWTNGRASIAVVLPAGVRADEVRVRLKPSPVRRIRVLINGKSVYDGKMTRSGLDQAFRVPASSEELTIGLESDTFRPGGSDPRELGVAVESVEVAHSACAVAPEAAVTRRVPNGPWYRDNAWVRDVLLANAADLRGLYFTGGEPMLEKQVEHILDRLIESGACEHIDLELNSNCTVLREPLLDKMLKFRHVTIGLSIDAQGASYEYIRFPAKWDTVRGNVERLMARAGDRLSLVAGVVFQAYNALNVVDVLEFFDGLNINFDIQIATSPSFLAIGVLPASVRAVAAHRLRAYADSRCKPHQRELVRTVARRIESIKGQSTPDALRTLMLFSNDLDATRQQNTRAVHGELLELLAAEGFHWTDELALAKAA